MRLGAGDRIEQLGRRMIQTRMLDRHQEYFSRLPLLFVGTADATGRPWASVLAGQPGFLQPIDAANLRVGARPVYGDPLKRALVEGADIGTLGLDFETRNRARVNGIIAQVGEDEFAIRVMQSFGNCPQYIQARELMLETGLLLGPSMSKLRKSKRVVSWTTWFV